MSPSDVERAAREALEAARADLYQELLFEAAVVVGAVVGMFLFFSLLGWLVDGGWWRRRCLHRYLQPTLVYKGEGRWVASETATCAVCKAKVRLPTDDFRIGRRE